MNQKPMITHERRSRKKTAKSSQQIFSRQRCRKRGHTTCLCYGTILLLTFLSFIFGYDEYDVYVQQVLKENHDNYGEDAFDANDYAYKSHNDSKSNDDSSAEQERIFIQENMMDEEEFLRQQQNEQEKKQRLLQEKELRKIQKERDEAFEAEVAKMEKKERKKALRQKRMDTKIINKLLHSSSKNDHYGVLQLWWNNLDIHIPKQTLTITIPFLNQKQHTITLIPDLHFFSISANDIKKAYRKMVKLVHPDKNHDGRAQMAFILIEETAAFLLNETLRKEYDTMICQQRIQLVQKIMKTTMMSVRRTIQSINQVLSTIWNVLGPFAFPVSIIVALLI